MDWIESQIPSEPVRFLDMIGVDASARGAGVGGALIRIGLERARADGVPAWLETGNAGNIPMYEHLGFRVIREDDIPGGGPHIWFLRT